MKGRIPIFWTTILVTTVSLTGTFSCAPTVSIPPVAASPPPGVPSPTMEAAVEVAFETKVTEDVEDDFPRSEVMLTWGVAGAEKAREGVGSVIGVCSPVPAGDGPDILRLSCWWAGQGMEYRLRRGGDSLVVERQFTAEEIPAGDEEPFEFVRRIELDPGAGVRPAAR